VREAGGGQRAAAVGGWRVERRVISPESSLAGSPIRAATWSPARVEAVLEQATAGDLLTIALDSVGERVQNVDNVRRC
jgi:hypothetical protein